MNDTIHTVLFAAIVLLLIMALAGYALIENPEPRPAKKYAWVVGEPLEVEYWIVKPKGGE